MCIDIEDIAVISEVLCIGCGQCVKACPFDAITIVNLPKELTGDLITHQYGENMFRIFKLPYLKPGQILGILGENGIGKSTLIKIISGSIPPNFGDYENPPPDPVQRFKGSEMQKFFKKLTTKKIITAVKPQDIEKDRGSVSGFIGDEIRNTEAYERLRIIEFTGKNLEDLSGGELQRLVCYKTLNKKADVYIFDEPSNYLDIKQRLVVAQLIRSLIEHRLYVIVIDHDISFLDYVSDMISIVYGQPGAYGVVAQPAQSGRAVNMYFEGYIPSENMRFRNERYRYDMNIDSGTDTELVETSLSMEYDPAEIEYPGFGLSVASGSVTLKSSINIILGKNGTGKSSFMKHLADNLGFLVSHKPQYPSLTMKTQRKDGSYPTVEEFMYKYMAKALTSQTFKNDVVSPLGLKKIKDKRVNQLSGGELQKLAIIFCLSRDVDVYLIDEPSSSLDIEQRINIIRAIKRHVINNHKTAFVIEHDITMSFALAKDINSSVIIFDELEPRDGARVCIGYPPTNLSDGMNRFLSILGVTFRKSEITNRYRINRIGSTKDQEQKKEGVYFKS